MIGGSKKQKAIIDISTVINGLKMSGTVREPRAFIPGKKNIGKGRTQGRTHGNAISLFKQNTIKEKVAILLFPFLSLLFPFVLPTSVLTPISH